MKAITVVIVLLLCLPAFGQFKPRGAFDYFVGSHSIMLEQSMPAYTGLTEWETAMTYGTMRVRIGADYTIKRFTAFFDQEVYMNKSQNISFQPLQAVWYAGAKFRIVENVHLKFEHQCIHPVVSNDSYDKQVRMYGGYNMFSISYGY